MQGFLDQINGMHPDTSFTILLVGTLAFIDILVKKKVISRTYVMNQKILRLALRNMEQAISRGHQRTKERRNI